MSALTELKNKDHSNFIELEWLITFSQDELYAEKAAEQLAALVTFAREHEWVANEDGEYCLACGYENPHHGKKCYLAAALANLDIPKLSEL
jgi:hypothetical protein